MKGAAAANTAEGVELALLVSGKSQTAMRSQARRLADWLETGSASLVDVAWTLAHHRTQFDVRAALVVTRREDAVARLRSLAESGTASAPATGAARLHAAVAEHLRGEAVAWSEILPPGNLVALPTYAFQREHFWLAPVVTTQPMPAASAPTDALATIHALGPSQREAFFLDLVKGEAAAVLGLASPEQIDADDRLFSIGFDSLRGTELRNRLRARIGVALPATLVFQHPTSRAIAVLLSDCVIGNRVEGGQPAYEELDL